jgi:hypothetical protein
MADLQNNLQAGQTAIVHGPGELMNQRVVLLQFRQRGNTGSWKVRTSTGAVQWVLAANLAVEGAEATTEGASSSSGSAADNDDVLDNLPLDGQHEVLKCMLVVANQERVKRNMWPLDPLLLEHLALVRLSDAKKISRLLSTRRPGPLPRSRSR